MNITKEKHQQIMKKYCWWIYFFVAIIISLYSQLDWISPVYFLLGSLVTFTFFIGIYFCFKKISSNKIPLRIVKSICVVILLGLVFVSWGFASMSGSHSSYCYNLVAKDIFTGNIKIHCNYPSWHTTIVGGEEARTTLLNDCLNRKTEFYDQNPNYCDTYKNPPVDKDWTKGPNP